FAVSRIGHLVLETAGHRRRRPDRLGVARMADGHAEVGLRDVRVDGARGAPRVGQLAVVPERAVAGDGAGDPARVVDPEQGVAGGALGSGWAGAVLAGAVLAGAVLAGAAVARAGGRQGDAQGSAVAGGEASYSGHASQPHARRAQGHRGSVPSAMARNVTGCPRVAGYVAVSTWMVQTAWS